jgi:phosphatidate cytidylyltransferase
MPADLIVPPWTAPGAAYAAGLLLVLMVGTLAAIVLLGGTRGGSSARRSLLRKWLTWVVLAATWWAAVFSGPLPVAILVTAFAIVGLREFAALTDLPAPHQVLLVVSAVLLGGLSLLGAGAMLATIPLLLLAGLLQPLLRVDVRAGIRDLAFGALAFAYLPLLLDHAVLIELDLPDGAAVLFATGLAIAGSDIGAYVVGRRFGRHPLAPVLSPNKTREGLLGNVLGAAVGYLLAVPILSSLAAPVLLVLPFVVALGAVWGDLFESALKREFGTKDTGTWLPGFGGLLDRIDSFILVIPLVYYVVIVADRVLP